MRIAHCCLAVAACLRLCVCCVSCQPRESGRGFEAKEFSSRLASNRKHLDARQRDRARFLRRSIAVRSCLSLERGTLTEPSRNPSPFFGLPGHLGFCADCSVSVLHCCCCCCRTEVTHKSSRVSPTSDRSDVSRLVDSRQSVVSWTLVSRHSSVSVKSSGPCIRKIDRTIRTIRTCLSLRFLTRTHQRDKARFAALHPTCAGRLQARSTAIPPHQGTPPSYS